MKNSLLIVILLLLSSTLHAQNPGFVWTGGMGGSSFGKATATVTEGEYIYTVGQFFDTFDFDPGTLAFNLESEGGGDVFIQKTNADKELEWVYTLGGNGNELAYDISKDSQNNLIICGSLVGIVDLNIGFPVQEYSARGAKDSFIIKINPEGEFLWGHGIGGTDDDALVAVDTDAEGNVYALGVFEQNLFPQSSFGIEDGWVTISASGEKDIYLMKMNQGGEPQWIKTIGGMSDDIPEDLVVTDDGTCYITGSFVSYGDFDPDPEGYYQLTADGTKDAFLLKTDSDGNMDWAFRQGDFASSGDHGTSGIALALDNDENVIFSGFFSGNPDLNPGGPIETHVSAGSSDYFIQKISPEKNLIWARSFGSFGKRWSHRT